MKPKLLIVDDDREIRTQMKWALTSGYDIVLAGDRKEALTAFNASRPAATLLDLGLPPHPNAPTEGLATLAELLEADGDAKVIIISGQAEKENALRAVGSGAYDFVAKPIDLEELRLILRRCLYLAGLEREHRALQESFRSEVFEGILGASQTMQAVFSSIRRVAKSRAPVLILGQSGTGKEMVARAIHRQSECKGGPFVPINCSAIPESLIESELFGHEKGAFTGANALRKGHIESAAGGTLFLDEIGDLALPIQVKLLRFLQEKTFQRVGGRQEIQSDARVVTATNADIKEMIKAGSFREDLYFRLAVVCIQLPALKDRGEDVRLIAEAFLTEFAMQNGRKGLSFAPETLRALAKDPWRGNVRELQNRVQRAVIMAEGKRITPGDLDLEVSMDDAPLSLKEARERAEREVVLRALSRNQGRISGAATELGISRPTLYELMEKLGIPKG